MNFKYLNSNYKEVSEDIDIDTYADVWRSGHKVKLLHKAEGILEMVCCNSLEANQLTVKIRTAIVENYRQKRSEQ